MKTICVAGKNSIAVNGLKYLLKLIVTTGVCILNPTDTGINGWQPSLKKYASEQKIETNFDQVYGWMICFSFSRIF